MSPATRHRYPPDWPQISKRVRFSRAQGRCECQGECGREHGGRCTAAHGGPHPVTGSRTILATAHLNHVPEDCRDANLRAMCQCCHAGYDADHHAEMARITRAARPRASQPVLFLTVDDVVRELRCSADTVRRMIRRGQLRAIGGPAFKMHYRIFKASLADYVERTSTPEPAA